MDEAGTCIGTATCPAGTALDPVSMTCKTVGTFVCPVGTVFDTNLNMCVGIHKQEQAGLFSGNMMTYLLIGAVALLLLMGRKS
jgi:hypothetical protein